MRQRFGVGLDLLLGALLFVTALAVGSTYVRVVEPIGNGPRSWDQSDYGAAVALACGRGYIDPGDDVPAVSAFLAFKTDRFSCADLPRKLPPHPPRLVQRLYSYLLRAVAGVWALRGVSWFGLWPLFGILYGLTVIMCYGLFRLGMGRMLSIVGGLAVTMSTVHLKSLPVLRDYAKAPFILGLILITAHVARRLDKPRSLLTLAALFGAVLGVGLGFRTDIVVVFPPFLVIMLLWECPRDRSAVAVRVAAVGVAAVTFIITAWPVLSAYSSGSNTGHVLLMGLISTFNQPLGIAGSIYDWAYVFQDEFANTLINSYTYQVHGHSVPYFTPEYDRAMMNYVLEIARHWPADILTRAYAAALKVVDLPFAVAAYADPVPHGISSPTVLQLYSWQIHALSVLKGTGVAVVALAMCVVGASSIRRALLLFAGLMYFAGYPAIFFDPRHFFHLEFIGWLALGFLVQRCTALAIRAVRMWRTGGAPPPLSLNSARRVAIFGVIASGILAIPLWCARAYQQRHLQTFLAGYADAAREPLVREALDVDDRTLIRASGLWDGRNPRQSVSTRYVVVVFAPGVCPAASLPVTFRYDARDRAVDYSLDMTLTLPRNDPPTEILFPAYQTDDGSRFLGVEVPRGLASCVREMTRVRDLRPLPIALTLTLVPDWKERPLYQTLADWEGLGPAPFDRIYTVPEKLPVARRLVEQPSQTPAVSLRSRLVRDDPAGGWSIVGTPADALPHLAFAPEIRGPEDRFVLQGEIASGGITVGLTRDGKWTEDGWLSLSTPGRFSVVLAPSTSGSFGVLVDRNLESSWLLRRMGSRISRLVGRFHVFNDIRIGHASWQHAS